MSEPLTKQTEGQEVKSPDVKDKPTEETVEETAEETAAEQGHKSKEDWVANGGDPKDWRSAEVFIERGVWIQRHKDMQKQINGMESTFNTRLNNVNLLHTQQMDMQKADLVRKRDDAIDLADREAANIIQKDIDKINTQTTEAALVNNGKSVLDTWNQSNSWIMQTTPKAGYAKQQFGVYQSQGMTVDQAIIAMENDVNREFPALNSGRENHPIPEGGTKPGKKRIERKLSMSDLTNDELKYYQAMPGAWKSDTDYLQAVQDTRNEL